MSSGWSPERRARQAELIHQWRPWEKTTGPKTAEGKAVVARNAWKGGRRAMVKKLRRALREYEQALQTIK